MTYAVAFERPENAIALARKLRESHPGLAIDVHSPYHLHELDELLPTRAGRVSALVFCGGLLGAAAAYGLQYLTAVKLYPFEVGATPFHAWPAFLPVTFEMGVLLASFAAFFGTLILCRLPRYHHRVFDVPGFERVSVDRFLLIVEGAEELEATLRQELASLEEGDFYVG